MQEYAKIPEKSPSDSNSKLSGQPPISEILQAYKSRTLQRASIDDEELLQAKTLDKSAEKETLQRYTDYTHRDKSRYNALIQGVFDTPQRKGIEDEELLQGKFESSSASSESPVQRVEQPNNTGLPDNLKSGIENLSGYSLDDVKVHYNSDKPAQLSALAYAQGTDIHVAPGQEQHLPHEAWHVVQQKQGRVQPTMQMQGVDVNDNEGLEREADVMGARVFEKNTVQKCQQRFGSSIKPIQRLVAVHGLAPGQYAQITRNAVLGWGRLSGPVGTVNLNPVTSNPAGHAEDHLIAQANTVIAGAAGGPIPVTPAAAFAAGIAGAAAMYTNLEIWLSSSPCSTGFGTRVGVLQGCLERLSAFAIANGMIVNVHAQKPYQPRGVGMKQNSVNASGSDPNVPHNFDRRTGIAIGLAPYVAPLAFAALGLGTVAQLSSSKEDDESEQLIRHGEKEKKTEGKVIVTYE